MRESQVVEVKSVGPGWSARVVAAMLAVIMVGTLAVTGGALLAVLTHEDGASSTERIETATETGSQVLYDEWNERISRDSSWRARGSWQSGGSGGTARSQGTRSNVQGPPPAPTWFVQPPSPNSWAFDPRRPGEINGSMNGFNPGNGAAGGPRSFGGYRTVCVRLCDGYFFPVSFGAGEGSFSRDQATCSSSCPGARLFYYRPGSEDPDDMVDVSGQSYSKLKNANLFRTQYVESCKCKPHPWEQTSVDRHRLYALEDQRRKGNRAVVAELEQLKGKTRAETAAGSFNRRRPADRARQPANEEAASQSQAATRVAQTTAPRSDASRGQSGPSSVVTGSIAAAASAVTVQAVTAASAAPAAPEQAGPQQASLQQLDPMTAVSAPLPAVQAAVAPEPARQPEPIIAEPFDPELAGASPPVAKAKRKATRNDRQTAVGGDMMRLGRNGESRRIDVPRRASSEWTRSVFGQ